MPSSMGTSELVVHSVIFHLSSNGAIRILLFFKNFDLFDVFLKLKIH